MPSHDNWMQRALQLARLGGGGVAPNPLVGAVLVQGDRILAEGWHQVYGGPHAEVECLRHFGDGPVPADAVMYVSLEPCSHHGRTPPCADLLLQRGVQQVVVAHTDPFPEVGGRGIERLRAAGVQVTVGVCEKEARWVNRRFLTSVEQGRPYIVLKWARSADGLLDRHPRGVRGVQRISSAATDVLVHRWRSEEQAILAGSRTVLHDDPALTVRHVVGRQPLRVVLDRGCITPAHSKVYDGSTPTLLFTGTLRTDVAVEQCVLTATDEPLEQLLKELHQRGIRSLFVEGGATVLDRFLARGLWDEARVLQGAPSFGQGTPAPQLPLLPVRSFASAVDQVHLYLNPASPASIAGTPAPAWPW
jgi:diaminohydroxyphosphoribosylaminopyrimidine deaminase/5-amino-6-(5-phosphoribosylamino)uracil reductase